MKKPFTLAAVLLLLGLAQATSGTVIGRHQAEAPEAAAVRKVLDAFAAAFNRGDATALAATFTTDAEYVDEGGEITLGREAIQKEVAGLFAETPDLKLALGEASVRLIRPDVATARGTATLTVADGGSADGGFTAVFVRENDSWRISNLQETLPPPGPGNSEYLQELAWLVGEWVDQDEEATVRTVTAWARNRSFLTRSFSVEIDGKVDLEGTQVIGWDPAAERIRSWVFDSDGGFSEEVWTRKGNRWIITSLGVLPDGGRASAVNILTRVDENRATWQSTERDSDGEMLPDVPPVTLIRQSTTR
jgi:uncharacterized protein (TIGR02246 family)